MIRSNTINLPLRLRNAALAGVGLSIASVALFGCSTTRSHVSWPERDARNTRSTTRVVMTDRGIVASDAFGIGAANAVGMPSTRTATGTNTRRGTFTAVTASVPVD